MIRETYIANLPYVGGFKVYVSTPNRRRYGCDICIDLDESKLVLKAVAYRSLTVPIYLAAECEDYSARHMLARKLESMRNNILRSREKKCY